MIELKENDLVKVKIDGENTFVIIRDRFKKAILSYDVIAVWRYNEETGNYLKIYDKEELCQPVKPADVPYDKYAILQSENVELRNIIVELNKKLYENNKIH